MPYRYREVANNFNEFNLLPKIVTIFLIIMCLLSGIFIFLCLGSDLLNNFSYGTLFNIIFFSLMFFGVPIVFIMSILNKDNSYVIGGLFILVPLIAILLIISTHKFDNPSIIRKFIFALSIATPVFIAGSYAFLYPILFNKKHPRYIKMIVTRIKQNTVYFSSPWGLVYSYHIKNGGSVGFFEVNKEYKINMTNYGLFNSNIRDLSKLEKKDFVKLN